MISEVFQNLTIKTTRGHSRHNQYGDVFAKLLQRATNQIFATTRRSVKYLKAQELLVSHIELPFDRLVPDGLSMNRDAAIIIQF